MDTIPSGSNNATGFVIMHAVHAVHGNRRKEKNNEREKERTETMCRVYCTHDCFFSSISQVIGWSWRSLIRRWISCYVVPQTDVRDRVRVSTVSALSEVLKHGEIMSPSVSELVGIRNHSFILNEIKDSGRILNRFATNVGELC